MHRAAAAAGDEHEVARVVAAPDRDEPQRVDHAGVGEPDDPVGGLLGGRADLLPEPPDRLQRQVAADRQAPAEEVVRVDHARHQLRVGDRRRRAALAVARGPRVGARAARPDVQAAGVVDPGDRAAARADLDDVGDGHVGRIARALRRPLELVLRRDLRLAVLDQRALGGRAADVEVDDVALADVLADPRRAHDAGGRAGLHEVDRGAPGAVERRGAAVGLHRVGGAREPARLGALLDLGEVAVEDGLHVGVEDRGARALVLAHLARHVPGGGDRDAREPLLQARLRRALVVGVRVGVQEADGDRLDLQLGAAVGHRVERVHVERLEHLARAVDALGHLEAQPARHERLRLVVAEVVHVRPVAAADEEDVAEAAGRHERGARALALGDRVDHDRAAVDEERRLGEVHPRRLDRLEHALGDRARGGRDLRRDQPAGALVERDQVGERAADVRGDAQAHRARRSAVARSSTVPVRGSSTTP